MRTLWQLSSLISEAQHWLKGLRARHNALASENSLWWSFLFVWPQRWRSWLEDFQQGKTVFSPMTQYAFQGETVRVWQYHDTLILRLILKIIKPVFKHLISARCTHLQGPSGVKTTITHLRNCLEARPYHYVIRADIRGYYESISRRLLTQQLHQHFQDPRLHNYFAQIVNIAVDRGGDVFVPTHGIPRRSSLSPFFGALYLSSLDRAMERLQGIQYFRYMDDFLVLAQTPRQYRRAKKVLFAELKKLKLALSPKKTFMGALSHSFHFLGVLFEVPRSPQTKTQVGAQVHPRSCARALDKVKAMQNDAVHPATMQRYLVRWAAWWSDTIQSRGAMSILSAWVLHANGRDPPTAWLGRGLIPRSFQTH